VTLVQDRVTALRGSEGAFVAELAGRDAPVTASRVVLATGVRDRFPEVDGFERHYGADVFHCPTCEGFDARDRDVVVLGWGPHVPAFATGLLDWAASVAVVTDGPDPRFTDEQRAGSRTSACCSSTVAPRPSSASVERCGASGSRTVVSCPRRRSSSRSGTTRPSTSPTGSGANARTRACSRSTSTA
jgi:hypothetical protein